MPDITETASARRPVAGRGRITSAGYQPENVTYLGRLTKSDSHGRRVGRDPGTIPLDVLTAAGHPRTNAARVVYRMREWSEASSGVSDKGVLFPLTQTADARLTTDGLQWIVERREHGLWRELGFCVSRVSVWQVCIDAGIVVGWDAEAAIMALPERFVRPQRVAPVELEAAGAGRATGVALGDLRTLYCVPCRPAERGAGTSMSGIRRCDTIDCPCWPYRLGFNPHRPGRGSKHGVDPFARHRAT
jgi:hypothetical protein